MHKNLNKCGLSGMALALVLIPAMAGAMAGPQEAQPDEMASEVTAPAQTYQPMTAEQATALQSWPADKQAAFKAWPAATQAYYWSLTEQRQQMFWGLSDSNKVSLSQMPEAQGESVWAQIEQAAAPSQV